MKSFNKFKKQAKAKNKLVIYKSFQAVFLLLSKNWRRDLL